MDAISSTEKNRRPIKARQTRFASASARWLQQRGATPNGISVASIFFAALAGMSLYAAFITSSTILPLILFIFAALMIQGRLLCNLLDGMVAVEGGLKSPAGAVYNELPDRIADTLILIGAGYGAAHFTPQADTLGWVAAFFAVMTAYVRVLGGSCGLEQRFSGPMAKQHRMALLTLGCIISAFLPQSTAAWLFFVLLWVIILGSLITTFFRTHKILQELAQGAH